MRATCTTIPRALLDPLETLGTQSHLFAPLLCSKFLLPLPLDCRKLLVLPPPFLERLDPLLL